MKKIDALLVADTFEMVLTKLEAFGDHFEHLATTADQRKLATEFNAFVGEIIQAMSPRGEEMGGRLSSDTEKEAFRKLHGHETAFDLFKEIREDEAAGKREDAHWYGKQAFHKILDGKTEALPTEKEKDRGIEEVKQAVNDKHRQAGFKALVEDHKNSSHYFEEMDGSHHLWPELSPQSKLQYIAGDAVLYDVPFEQFAEGVRDVLPPTVLVEASLKMVLHYERELHGLGKLLPGDGRTESLPLVERFKEIMDSQSDHSPADKGNDRGIER